MTKELDSTPKVYPCNVCGEDAIACLRPDMDIKGICFCEEHRDEVYSVYMILGNPDSEPLVKQLMKDWKFK